VTVAQRLRGLHARATLDGLHWTGSAAEVRLRAGLELGPERRPWAVLRRGGRAFLDPALTEGLLDTPYEIEEPEPWGRLQCYLRNQVTGEEWRVPAKAQADLHGAVGEGPGEDPAGRPARDGAAAGERVTPAFMAVARVDVDRIAAGRPLAAGRWDLRVRVHGPGIDRRADLVVADGDAPAPYVRIAGPNAVTVVAGIDGTSLWVTGEAGSLPSAGDRGTRVELPAPRVALPAPASAEPGSDLRLAARQGGRAVRLAGRVEAAGGSQVLAVDTGPLVGRIGTWELGADEPAPGAVPLAIVEVADAARATAVDAAGPGGGRGGRTLERLARAAARRLPGDVPRRLARRVGHRG
jgi:hypothetical protein